MGDPNDKPEAAAELSNALGGITRADLQRLSDSSSGAMGGERPKLALYLPDTRGGPPRAVLLKFALPSERPDHVVAEAAALTLAAQLGLRVPPHEVRWFNDTPALCIERFDRDPGLLGPAWHCVSAATALGLVPSDDVDDPRRSYVRLRARLKRPADARELFARIVLNAAVGNADDHPWNTSLRQRGPGDWELSPLYDVMPFSERRALPVFRMDLTRQHPSRAATRQNLVAAGRQIAGLTADAAAALIEQTHDHVRRHWRAAFDRHAAAHPDADATRWVPVFEHDWLQG